MVCFIFNKTTGIGLLEIITDPDFKTGLEAASFVRELQNVLRMIDASDGRMDRKLQNINFCLQTIFH